ncbi:acyl-CoA dehydrogenase family protein [Deinococcus koreensis]|uniref:Glycosyl transferase family 1 n=1 Tax=Deinococcus koreensis TaxID=2054903 RepID=A0A2K3USM2_9DEIO|nr:acyl-CoA dehydrogenase family protein [Deinococcus koreensis]PNY79518.1 glycosyl transferase family 1 [Deinococcus koreensis]
MAGVEQTEPVEGNQPWAAKPAAPAELPQVGAEPAAAAEAEVQPPPPAFSSFVLGGFECSTHRRPSGRRIDIIDATAHDRLARQDYERLRASGLGGARDGLRWHLIETAPGHYDFRSAQLQVEAARGSGLTVIWDLLHYGVPDHVDVFAPDFPQTFAAFAHAATTWLRAHTQGELWLCPVNEISFFAWGGGDVGYLPPFARGRGPTLKANLVRAAIAAMDAARAVDPAVRFVHAEPLIQVTPHPERPDEAHHARIVHDSQYEALDMLMGRVRPELGGAPHYVDVVGVNYYPYNQWRHHGDHGQREVLPLGHPDARPLASLLGEVYARFGRPLLIAETGTEDEARAPWFEEVATQALRAARAGVPVLGVCLYPVVNHPGWDDDRHCHNGLWDYPDELGHRAAYGPLADAVTRVLRAAARAEGEPAEEVAPTPPDARTALDSARARFRQALETIEAEADARGADGAFPAASFAALRDAGLLTVTLPPPDGGDGLAGPGLLELLRSVGRASLSVGRVYEGHLNALELIARYGTPEQRTQAAQDAGHGELFGVWNTEEAPGVALVSRPDGGWTLSGAKAFTSGAGFVGRALVPAELPGGQGRTMVLLRGPVPPERFDPAFWTPLGMRATLSLRADLTGLPVEPGDLIGPPGAYYAQPEFGGGALRFLAVQLGGADALLEAGCSALRQIGRAGDDVQRLRFAELAAGLEAAWQTVLQGGRLLAQSRLAHLQREPSQGSEATLAYIHLARMVTEDACLRCAEGIERAVGARGLLQPGITRRLLDLRMYLRQPAPDAARLALGRHVLEGPGWPDAGWSLTGDTL